MPPGEHEGLRCPACGGDLASQAVSETRQVLACRGCGGRFPVELGIPDLRVFDDPYIEAERDRLKGRGLAERAGTGTFRDLVAFYYSTTDVVPPEHAEQYTRGLMAAEPRSEAANRLRSAHAPPPVRRPSVLSVGCGTAPALAADASSFAEAVGVDIAFRWLVVGRKRLEESGRSASLYCCCAEALPFSGSRFDLVIADFTLEHVRSRERALEEIHRVLRPGGVVWVAAANRWSLGPDPQTGLPAGGYLPQALVDWWVRRKGGIPPERRLLSAGVLRQSLEAARFDSVDLLLPEIPAAHREAFGPLLQFAARGYEVLRRWTPTAALLEAVGPSLLAVGRKTPERNEASSA